MNVVDKVDMEKPASFFKPDTFLKTDSGSVPDHMREESPQQVGNARLPREAYTSAAFHQKEVDHLWKKVWQFACRENDIPNVGDRIAYDIADQSVMVVRTAPDTIKAFHNTCQHRGARLVEQCGSGQHITCPFHAWSWNLDGTINTIPARWDFPGVSNTDVALAEVRCERWNSFVFINLDKNAPTLADYIGPDLLRHWKAWPRTRERKIYHLAKIIPCNWKLVQGAFAEVYHVLGTHTQSLQFTADCNAQYDLYGLHSRFISTSGTPSAYIADTTDPQEIVDACLGSFAENAYPDGFPQVRTVEEARVEIAKFMRNGYEQRSGVDMKDKSDAEMIDSIGYHFFPNSIIWGGYCLPIIHRFRPNGDDPNSCFWEFMGLERVPDGPMEKDAQMVMLAPDEPFEKHLGFLGYNLDQDVEVLKVMQRGIKSDGFTGPRYAMYQERIVRNFENNLATYLARK